MMYLPDPRKFDGVKRLVDVRLTAKNCKDHIYDFLLTLVSVRRWTSVWYEPKQEGSFILRMIM